MCLLFFSIATNAKVFRFCRRTKHTVTEYNVLWWSEFYKHNPIDELVRNNNAMQKFVFT